MNITSLFSAWRKPPTSLAQPGSSMAPEQVPELAALEARRASLPNPYADYLDPGRVNPIIHGKAASEIIPSLARHDGSQNQVWSLIGAPGSGLSILLARIVGADEFAGDNAIEIIEPRLQRLDEDHGVARQISPAFGDSSSDLNEIVKAAINGPPKIVILRETQLLYRRDVLGCRALDDLAWLVSATTPRIAWVLACRESGWRRMIRTGGIDRVITASVTLNRPDSKTFSDVVSGQLAQADNVRFSSWDNVTSDQKTWMERLYEVTSGDLIAAMHWTIACAEMQQNPVEPADAANNHDEEEAKNSEIKAENLAQESGGDNPGMHLLIRIPRKLDLSMVGKLPTIHQFTLTETLAHDWMDQALHQNLFQLEPKRSARVLEELRVHRLLTRVSGGYQVNPLLKSPLEKYLRQEHLFH